MIDSIKNQLELVNTNLKVLADFCAKYDLPEASSIHGFEYRPRVSISDVILAGKLFGKDGWVRERDRYCEKVTYNWTQTIDNVIVKITSAEVQDDMNGVPVPPKAFPIQLEENVS